MATKPMPVHGADISHHQSGALNLPAFKRAGGKWLYHKATEGDSFVDSNYSKRRAEAAKAGIPFGAYHFARAERGDAVAEARRFVKVAAPKPGDLRPALDLETSEGLSISEIRTWAKAFVNEVKRLTGVLPIVYTPYDLGDAVKGCLIWRPRYNNSNTPPVLRWDIWQFSNGQFGLPNSVAGLGHVDLNTMRQGLTVAQMQIPKPTPVPPKPPAKKKAKLKFAHLSLQFSDSKAAQTADLEKLFARGYDVITGTEAGHVKTDWNQREVSRVAAKYGYKVSNPVGIDTWVAVKASLVASGWKASHVHVLEQSSQFTPKPPGRWGDKGIAYAEFNMGKTFGAFAVGSCHYLTWGGAGKDLKLKTDKQYATALEKWRASYPAATEVFAAGDWNRNEKQYDVFMGIAKFLSAPDELKKYENTGHGPIDSIAREKASTRVKAVAVRVLDDTELSFNTDHFLVEVDYEVTAL